MIVSRIVKVPVMPRTTKLQELHNECQQVLTTS